MRAVPGFSVFTIAVPSRMTTSTVGVPVTFSERRGTTSGIESSIGVGMGTSFSRQLTMSDLVPSCSLPIFESDGGYA